VLTQRQIAIAVMEDVERAVVGLRLAMFSEFFSCPMLGKCWSGIDSGRGRGKRTDVWMKNKARRIVSRMMFARTSILRKRRLRELPSSFCLVEISYGQSTIQGLCKARGNVDGSV